MAFLTQPPDPLPRRPALALPPGACDCHFHLFGPAPRYPARLRGIMLPRDDLQTTEIQRLDGLGVRGMRFISERRHGKLPCLDPGLARRAFDAAGWQVHFYPKDDLQAMAPQLLALPNTVVLDHFGGIDADAQPDLGVLMSLLDSGRVWVKLSGPMRCTREDFPYAKVTPLARRLVDHAPERLIWGSDWPHVNMNDRAMPNDGDLVDLLKEWFPSESALRRVLCENPAALFGFSAA